MCVSPAALAVMRPAGVTSAIAGFKESYCAHGVASKLSDFPCSSLQVDRTVICCWAPGAMTRFAGSTASPLQTGSLIEGSGAPSSSQRLNSS